MRAELAKTTSDDDPYSGAGKSPVMMNRNLSPLGKLMGWIIDGVRTENMACSLEDERIQRIEWYLRDTVKKLNYYE
jgi:hypothetical protein